MQTQLNNILQAAKEQLANAATLAEVNDVRVKYMGKKGEVTQILKGMGKLPPEEKKELTLEDAVALAEKAMENGSSASDAAKEAAKLSGFKKGEIYKLLMN